MNKKKPQISVRFKERDRQMLEELRQHEFNLSAFVRRALRKRFERMSKQKIK